MTVRQRQPRAEAPKHLAFIRRLPCVVCGSPHTEAAHIRYADIEKGKRQTGKGEKPDDRWTVPLCRADHAAQHATNERLWWTRQGIDPLTVAEKLHEHSGDLTACEKIARLAKWL